LSNKIKFYISETRAKTKAQPLREYRKRQKTNDPNFLKMERQRVKQYYVPTSSKNPAKMAGIF
jgi:hypothetical protein